MRSRVIFWDMKYDNGIDEFGRQILPPQILEFAGIIVDGVTGEEVNSLLVKFKKVRPIQKSVANKFGCYVNDYNEGVSYKAGLGLIEKFITGQNLKMGICTDSNVIEFINIYRINLIIERPHDILPMKLMYFNTTLYAADSCSIVPQGLCYKDSLIRVSPKPIPFTDLVKLLNVEASTKYGNLLDRVTTNMKLNINADGRRKKDFFRLTMSDNNCELIEKYTKECAKDIADAKSTVDSFIDALTYKDIDWEAIGIMCDNKGRPIINEYNPYVTEDTAVKVYFNYAYNIREILNELEVLSRVLLFKHFMREENMN